MPTADESAPYRDYPTSGGLTMPPNRPLRTLDELHMVAGMKDDFFTLLQGKVTIFGSKGININYAPKELLMFLDPTFTDEAAAKVIERRNDKKLGGPFKDEQDFYAFVQPLGVDVKGIQDSKIPLLFEQELNFRVISTGVVGNLKREITAVTYDFTNLTGRLAEQLNKQDQEDNKLKVDPPGSGPKKPKFEAPKGRPRVVSWEES
jgi:general secretion pathway protein K